MNPDTYPVTPTPDNTEYAGMADFFFSQWQSWILAEEASQCRARGKKFANWFGAMYRIDYDNGQLILLNP